MQVTGKISETYYWCATNGGIGHCWERGRSGGTATHKLMTPIRPAEELSQVSNKLDEHATRVYLVHIRRSDTWKNGGSESDMSRKRRGKAHNAGLQKSIGLLKISDRRPTCQRWTKRGRSPAKMVTK